MSITPRALAFVITALSAQSLDAQAGCVTAPSLALRLANTAAGSPGYVRVSDSSTLRPVRFTIEAWVTPRGNGVGFTTDGGGASVVAKPRLGSVGTYIASWVLSWEPVSGTFIFGVTSTFNSQGVYARGSLPVRVNTTGHVAFTFDGSFLRLYVNGVLDTQVAYPYAAVYYGSEPVLIGAAEYGVGYYRRFDGEIDELRIWDHARSNEQVLGSMHCRIGNDSGLVASYAFDQADARDLTANGNHGALQGSTGSFVAERVALSLAQGCPRLSADVGGISLVAGGAQHLFLQGTPAQAGNPYLVIGTSTGTLPGFVFNGLRVPLNADAYLTLTLSNYNASPILVNTFGILDGNARASAAIGMPPGAFRSLAGLVLEHAFVSLPVTGPLGISQPVPVTLRL